MPAYHFPGYPVYLDAAAAELGRQEAAVPARRISAVATIANLCAQAAVAPLAHVDGILSKASEACDHLRVAHRAAELMVNDVRKGREVLPSPEIPEPTPHPKRRKKASRSSA